jgi:hypothetical protein
VLAAPDDGLFIASSPSVALFGLSVDDFGSLFDDAPEGFVVELPSDGSKRNNL